MKPRIRQQRHWDVTRHLVGLQINLLREAHGWSMEELAEKAMCSVAVVDALERGNLQRASLAVLERLAAAFDVAILVRFEGFQAYWPKAFEEEENP